MQNSWIEILTPKPWCCANDGGNSLKVTPELGGLYTYPCGWATAVSAKHEITTTNVFILHTIKSTIAAARTITITPIRFKICLILYLIFFGWNSGRIRILALSVSLVNLRLMVSESDWLAFIWISLPSLLSPMTTVLTFIQNRDAHHKSALSPYGHWYNFFLKTGQNQWTAGIVAESIQKHFSRCSMNKKWKRMRAVANDTLYLCVQLNTETENFLGIERKNANAQ